MTVKIQSKTKGKLKKIIDKAIKEKGPNCDLNFIDTYLITDMSHLFSNSEFNGDISSWDVGNVTDMSGMFTWSDFDSDISEWDVSNVENAAWMLCNCKLEKKAKLHPKFNFLKQV